MVAWVGTRLLQMLTGNSKKKKTSSCRPRGQGQGRLEQAEATEVTVRSQEENFAVPETGMGKITGRHVTSCQKSLLLHICDGVA